jgi:hypothetical protein
MAKDIIKAYFCPKCKSLNVFHPFKVSNLFGLIAKWECKDCKYKAVQFPLLVTSKKELAKKSKGVKK